MATVNGLTAEAMQAIRNGVIVGANIVAGHLILVKYDATTIDAGPVIGPTGPTGPGGIQAVLSTGHPGSPTEGLTIWETDNDKVLMYDGTTWTLPKNIAGGELGYAETATPLTGVVATIVDVPGVSVTVNPLPNRKVELAVFVPAIFSTVTNDSMNVMIREGATILQIMTLMVHQITTYEAGGTMSLRLTPSAGAHTYKVSAQRAAGTGTMQITAAANQKISILAKDIGGV